VHDNCAGEFCEDEVDVCQSSPCVNNGTCVSSVLKSEYTCICSLGFTGTDCSQRNYHFFVYRN